MDKRKHTSAEFVVDSNVHVEIIDSQNVVRQTLDIHNKACKQLVSGILRFLRGEFNTTYKQSSENSIVYKNQAKNYIPCFVGFGTAGIRTVKDSEDIDIPDYDPTNRRNPPIGDIIIDGESIPWNSEDNRVSYNDVKLKQEITSQPRFEIGVLQEEEQDDYNVSSGDIQQIVFMTDVTPGYYNRIYGGNILDIFITEMGLFASNDTKKEDLLARVIFKTSDDILYVRPQDTMVIKWIISIIALNDCSAPDEDIEISTPDGEIDIEADTPINDEIIQNIRIISEEV